MYYITKEGHEIRGVYWIGAVLEEATAELSRLAINDYCSYHTWRLSRFQTGEGLKDPRSTTDNNELITFTDKSEAMKALPIMDHILRLKYDFEFKHVVGAVYLNIGPAEYKSLKHSLIDTNCTMVNSDRPEKVFGLLINELSTEGLFVSVAGDMS